MKKEEKTVGKPIDTRLARRAAALKRNMARRKQVRAATPDRAEASPREAAHEPR